MKKTPKFNGIPPKEFDGIIDPILGKICDPYDEAVNPAEEKRQIEEPIEEALIEGVRHKNYDMPEEE